MKIFKSAVCIIVIVLLFAGVGGYCYLQSTLPEYNGQHSVDILKDEVKIIRDSYGMAHIYAKNDPDAYFALGYCQAQDRLFQMDMARRAGKGTLSEVLGAKLRKVDRLFRTLHASVSVEYFIEKLTPEVAVCLKSFTEGIN